MGLQETSIAGYNANIYTPSGTGPFPVFVEIPGAGECGTDRSKLYLYGGLYFVKNKGWAPNFKIIGVQPLASWPPNRGDVPSFLRSVLDVIAAMPDVDKTKIYLSGYSNGCATIMEYIQYEDDAHYHPIAGVIGMSMNMFAVGGDYGKATDYMTGGDLRFKTTALWAFCGNTDAFRASQSHYCDLVKGQGGQALYTEYAGGHCCWNTPKDPSYKGPNGMDTYTWALQYPKAVVAPPPVVVPAPKTITSVSTTYTYSDGTKETITRP